MSHNHSTEGYEKFDCQVQALEAAGIQVVLATKEELDAAGKITITKGLDLDHCCYCGYGEDKNETCECCRGECGHRQQLRIARFKSPTKDKVLVMEEYLAIDDRDCDGMSEVDVIVYDEGNRPELTTTVLEA